MKRYALFAFLIPFSFLFTQHLALSTQHSPAPAWRATTIPADFTCFDPIHPHVVYTAVATGTLAYDWDGGPPTFISRHKVAACGPTGWLYSGDPYQPDPLWRFSRTDPIGQPIAHLPTIFAQDGSSWVYSS